VGTENEAQLTCDPGASWCTFTPRGPSVNCGLTSRGVLDIAYDGGIVGAAWRLVLLFRVGRNLSLRLDCTLRPLIKLNAAVTSQLPAGTA
jgi:hypothetical protein